MSAPDIHRLLPLLTTHLRCHDDFREAARRFLSGLEDSARLLGVPHHASTHGRGWWFSYRAGAVERVVVLQVLDEDREVATREALAGISDIVGIGERPRLGDGEAEEVMFALLLLGQYDDAMIALAHQEFGGHVELLGRDNTPGKPGHMYLLRVIPER